MPCTGVDCEHCKADLLHYLSDPRSIISSAAGNSPKSLEDLRTLVRFGSFTPGLVEEILSVFFFHLSAGDQSGFDPVKPIPPNLRPLETKAFLSMAGIFTMISNREAPDATHATLVKALVGRWSKIRNWIQHFFYRALARTASPAEEPITDDEAIFAQNAEGMMIFNMILVIVTIVSFDHLFFNTIVAGDGTYSLIVKLWGRMVRFDVDVSAVYYERAVLLLVTCLQSSKPNEGPDSLQSQFIREAGGAVEPIATYLIKPLRSAAKSKLLSELLDKIGLLGCSLSLITKLSGGDTNRMHQTELGHAFFSNPRIDFRPLLIKVLRKYTALCNKDHLPPALLAILRTLFRLCGLVLFYHGSVGTVVKLLDDEMLEAYVNMAPGLKGLTDLELGPAAHILKQTIATFLTHESIITAAKTSLQKLERDRAIDCLTLKETESGLKDAWRYFTCHVVERAVLKGVYDSNYCKKDILICEYCDVSMNTQVLKKCSGCKFAHYCSRECQTKDWRRHKRQCTFLARDVEVFKLKARSKHFFAHLIHSDIMRHVPGLYELAQRNPRTSGADACIAYSLDYTCAPPQFTVFPAADIADDEKYLKLGIASDKELRAKRHEIWDAVRKHNGAIRILQVETRGHERTSVVSFKITRSDRFKLNDVSVPRIVHTSRPRAVDEDGKVLGVQTDWPDVVMIHALFGRAVSDDELRLYTAGFSNLALADQEKTLMERVDDAVKRLRNMDEGMRDALSLL